MKRERHCDVVGCVDGPVDAADFTPGVECQNGLQRAALIGLFRLRLVVVKVVEVMIIIVIINVLLLIEQYLASN